MWAFYVLGLLVFQEVVFRWAFPLPELANFDRVNYLTPGKPLTDAPPFGRSTWFWQSFPDTARAFEHQLNAYGFRDTEWRMAKPADKKRLLLIGDSFVEGVMAEQEQNLSAWLQQSEAMQGWEVMNAGILGAGVNSYLQLTSDMVPLFQPDVVLVVFFANDFTTKPIRIPKDRLMPEKHSRLLPRLWQWWEAYLQEQPLRARWATERNSWLPAIPASNHPWTGRGEALRQEVTEAMAMAIEKGELNYHRANEIRLHARQLEQKVNLASALDFLKRYTDQYHAELRVAYLPARHQVTNYYYPYERALCLKCPQELDLRATPYQLNRLRLGKQCVELGIPFVDLSPVVQASEDAGQHLYWNYDDHFRAQGYRLSAEELVKAFDWGGVE